MQKLEKKWLTYKFDSNWTAYKKAINSYYVALNASKKSSLRLKIKDCEGDSKKLHKLVKNLTTKSIDNPLPPGLTDQQQADSFADYFENKILNIRRMFENIQEYNITSEDIPRLRRFSPMIESSVALMIKSMKSKSCELDAIPTHILKTMLPALLLIITKLVNLLLGTGDFYRDWKTATVRPLLKKNGLQLINSNYRLVSNLTFISKLVERCMWAQVNNHCKEYNLQPDYQSAYREGYSCETALLHVSYNIHIMPLTALDLSAAFDTVDHQILLRMLNNKFGIDDTALLWFDSYLCPHSFRVFINKTYSHEVDLTYGVPQGSVAGANIFNLYCSTLQEVIPKDLHLSGFGDDHSVQKEFDANNRDEEHSVKDKIEQCILTIKSWMDGVHLKMNPSKTEFIYFGNAVQLKKCTCASINIDADLILRSPEIRYLGAWLDSNLNYKTHITKKCSAAMANLQRIKSI